MASNSALAMHNRVSSPRPWGTARQPLLFGGDFIIPGKIIRYFSDVPYDLGLGTEFVVDFRNLDAGFTFTRLAGGSFGASFRGVVTGSLSFESLVDQAGSDTSVVLTILKGGVGASVDGDGAIVLDVGAGGGAAGGLSGCMVTTKCIGGEE